MPNLTEIEWAEPPAPRKGPGSAPWKEVADGLRTRPGEWALIAREVSPGTAQHIKRGLYKGIEPGEFEATNRANGYEHRRVDVYARYIGPVR